MASLNQVTLIGNLGRDPEIRRMTSGDAVANLSIATSETWKDKNSGERKEKTEWHRVVIFGKVAEIAEKYLKKGSKVLAQGKLATRKWTDKDGLEKFTTEVVLQGFDAKMVMLDSATSGGSAGGQNAASASASRGQATQDLDDDIPF